MILEARRGALAEVLVIASALSVQDVRDRPMDRQAGRRPGPSQVGRRKSEFTGTLPVELASLTDLAWWPVKKRVPTNRQPTSPKAQPRKANARSQHSQPPRPPPARVPKRALAKHQSGAQQPPATHKLRAENLLREHFINVRRVREWRDIHTQLHTVVAEHGWHLNTTPRATSSCTKACWPGCWATSAASRRRRLYLGARGIKFHRHPGAHLSKKPGRWIVVAELVETTRLFGRGIANIEPQWLEQVGGHLLHRQAVPTRTGRRRRRGGGAGARHAVWLGGLQRAARQLRAVDPAEAAREIFIRERAGRGLVGRLAALPFLAANQKLIRQVEELEHKARRQDVLVDDELIYAFYDQQLPADVCTGVHASSAGTRRAEVRSQPPADAVPATN
jgi:ATP-dependent helicase HrpA